MMNALPGCMTAMNPSLLCDGFFQSKPFEIDELGRESQEVNEPDSLKLNLSSIFLTPNTECRSLQTINDYD